MRQIKNKTFTSKWNLWLIIFSLFGLGSCRVPQENIRDQAHVPDRFKSSTSDSLALKGDTSSIASLHWDEFFLDKTLLNLIDTALAHNFDLQLAIKNIEAAQLLFKQAKTGYYPDVNLQVTANTSRPSDNSLNGLSLNQFLGSKHIEDYTAAISLSWEADIWGKIKSQKAAALANYLQTEEAQKAVQTQLVAQVAQGYFNLLMLYQQLETAKQNLALNDSTLSVIRQQYEVGDVSLLGLEQAEAQRLTAASLVPNFEQAIALQENALHVLSGTYPSTLKVKARLSEIRIPEDLPAGVPSSLLSRRPDVRQAELAVVTAQANTHFAKASLYPSLTITAQGGVNAFTASNWFNIPASLFGAAAGGLTQPIFQRRQLKTQYQVAKIDQEKSVIQFKQSVVKAVGEVSDALVKIDKLAQQEQLNSQRTDKLQQAIQHANLLFSTGEANYLEVITAQSNVLQSELELAEVKKAQLDAMVDLYRALGGGWL